MTDTPSSQNNRQYNRPWLWPVIVSIPLALLCVWLLWQIIAGKAQGVDIATKQSIALEQEVQRLQALVAQDPCTIAKALGLPPVKRKSESGAVTVTTTAEGTVPKTVPNAVPDAVPKTTPDTASSKVEGKAVADFNVKQIESATVLVIGVNSKGDIGIGTGFFIAPGLLVTNRHVIENSTKSYITNKVLGGLIPVSVKAISDNTQRDYALLEYKGKVPAGVNILPLNLNLEKTEKVSAWGYPTAISKSDPQFLSLVAGNAQSIPEVIYSEGVVSAILQRDPKLIAHTAPLSPGNSGGPLLNANGHIVGINTMISLDDDSYRQTSLSLPSTDLLEFLHGAGVKPQTIVRLKSSE